MITLPFKQNAEKVPETKKEGRRRTSQYVESLLMKVYNALHFKSAERREGIRDEERGPTAYYCYVEALSMKYMMPYMRSALVWINCAAILTAISAGVSLPMSIPMGVITRASCCSL